jgi:hypothetical protein
VPSYLFFRISVIALKGKECVAIIYDVAFCIRHVSDVTLVSLTQEVRLYASYASMNCYILQWFYNAFSLVFGAPGYPVTTVELSSFHTRLEVMFMIFTASVRNI